MRTLPAGFAALALMACGEAPPPPAPKPAAAAAAPVAPPAPEPKTAPVEVKAPAPDPNKALASRVKEALLADRRILGEGIDVTASDGKVTLWGTTASDTERRQAAGIAGKVDGVKAVDNQLKVVKGS